MINKVKAKCAMAIIQLNQFFFLNPFHVTTDE